jgi:hypothetical protein
LSRSNIAALRRRYHEHAALSRDESFSMELSTLDHFGESLPSVPTRRLAVGVVLAVLLVAYGLAAGVFRSEQDAVGIARAMEGVLTLDPHDAADAIGTFELRGALGAFFVIALSFVVVGAPFASAFWLQRLLLNRYPLPAHDLAHESIAGHSVRSEGVYALEARAFARAEQTSPGEIQIDLVVRAIALLLPVWLALIIGSFAAFVVEDTETFVRAALGCGAALLFLLAADSLITTWTTARMRRLRRGTTVSAGTRTASLRRPALAVAGVALLGGTFGYLQASPEHGVVASISRITVAERLSFATYLRLLGVDPASAPAAERNELGMAVRYELRAWAPRGTKLRMRFRVIALKPQRHLLIQQWETLETGGSAISASRSSGRDLPNARDLVLLHIVSRSSPGRLPEGPPDDQCRCSTFLPVDSAGRHLITAAAFRDESELNSAPLDLVTSKPFWVGRS